MATDTTYPALRAKTRSYLRKLAKAQPATVNAFNALHSAACAAGALDVKTKELIALALAVGTCCDDCVAIHVHDALRVGATGPEITDALGVAVLMGGGPALMYAAHAMEALEEFQAVSSEAAATAST
jgi:AhpD family alkylhydroperoxidase